MTAPPDQDFSVGRVFKAVAIFVGLVVVYFLGYMLLDEYVFRQC